MKSKCIVRILSVFLSLFIIIGVIAISKDNVLALTDPATGLEYSVSSGKVTIIGFTAPVDFDGELVIPDMLSGYPVTSILGSTFLNLDILTGVILPNTLLRIGSGAFDGCDNLASVTIPYSVTSIGDRAFYACSNLPAIHVDEINSYYKSINGALYSEDGAMLICCPAGKTGSFTISNSTTTVYKYAFSHCSGLTGITIPDSILSIGDNAFEWCDGLTVVSFPASVTSIGDNALIHCSNISSVTFAEGNMFFKSIDGVVYSESGTQLLYCPPKKTGSLPIPDGVQSIESRAFWGCGELNGITIPNSVTSIDTYAFYGCVKLTGISIPGGVTSIPREAFSHCSSLTEIIISNRVTSIGYGAFTGCNNLSDAYFFGNAPTMDTNVFSGCAADFIVNYLSTATGYTNPWNGYTTAPFSLNISYQTHVQDVGWQYYVSDGEVSGTSGQSKRLEAIRINLSPMTGGIEYRTHVQDIGWQTSVGNNELSGTSGQSKRLEAIQIRLTGGVTTSYDIYYRVHAQNVGWMDWAKNGAPAGTAGYSYRLEAIEIRLIEKGGAAPGPTTCSYIDRYSPANAINYKTHVQDVGWQDYVSTGMTSGTIGQSKRLEAIQIKLNDYPGGIEYRTHVQDIGWMDWVANDAMSGTSGQSKRLEAIQIRLTGEIADVADIYYCVHAQNMGWLDWAKNGQSAGTAGFGYRLEAIQIVLIPKGGPAPGPGARAFVQG